MMEWIELPNKNKTKQNKTEHCQRETYKYLGTLEAGTIKQVDMEKKKVKSISEEWESFSKPNYLAEISSMG